MKTSVALKERECRREKEEEKGGRKDGESRREGGEQRILFPSSVA